MMKRLVCCFVLHYTEYRMFASHAVGHCFLENPLIFTYLKSFTVETNLLKLLSTNQVAAKLIRLHKQLLHQNPKGIALFLLDCISSTFELLHFLLFLLSWMCRRDMSFHNSTKWNFVYDTLIYKLYYRHFSCVWISLYKKSNFILGTVDVQSIHFSHNECLK